MIPTVRVNSLPEASLAVQDFRDFFDAEYRRLSRALFLITGSVTEAEDLAQDALVRVFERWERVRAMASPTGYLYRTAMNLHRSRLRHFAMAARRLITSGTSSDPSAEVEGKDEIDRLLRSLPAGQRAALVLVEWLGLDAAEAAAVLGIEPVSVRVRLWRARDTLRNTIGGGDE